MSKPLGYKATKLLKMLNASFPTFGRSKVVWLAEDLHIASGFWRTNVNADVWRWNAYSRFVRDDGTLGGTAHGVGSYTPITELIKSKHLTLGDDEVFGSDKESDHDQ